MKKGLKKLLIFGGLVAAGIVVYHKSKKSEEENFVKEVSNAIKEKVDETMNETDVKEFIDKKAKKIVKDLSFIKTLDRLSDKLLDSLIRKVRRTIEKKISAHLLWGELFN